MPSEEKPMLFRRKQLNLLKDFDPAQAKLRDWVKVVNTEGHIILENKETKMKAHVYEVGKSFRVLFVDRSGSEPYDRTFKTPADAIEGFLTVQGQLW